MDKRPVILSDEEIRDFIVGTFSCYFDGDSAFDIDEMVKDTRDFIQKNVINPNQSAVCESADQSNEQETP